MKAYMLKSATPDKPIDGHGKLCDGLKLAYITKLAHPVFALEGEERWGYADHTEWVEAPPGMVGQSQRGDKLYLIDADGDVREIPARVILLDDYVRFYELYERMKQEEVTA